MHYLAFSRLHLSRLHPLTRVLLTLYVATVAGAMWIAVLKYTDRATFGVEGMTTYVRGSGQTALDDPFGDPFAGTDEGLVLDEPMTRRQLVDIVHPHWFSVPVVLFILGHLLLLTRLPFGWKLGLNLLAFAAFGATFGVPFLLLGSPAWTPVLMASSLALVGSILAICTVLLYETWIGKPGDAALGSETSRPVTSRDG